ncbi:phytoene/squalene synthase family protein [Nocardia brasiliensis]|uniref:Phytoene synthase n=1 Tax=Nocardia brasiliensis (strain ATCC 700358 / HUJEG-1) TaxID=1133849 RepID=K0ETT8_NOCB7|nr:phytoene/squalene synthase family protein [Nocardia brasiliensis]AFU00270.1 phytoene synthase [Nocardia brasiliensis ATCC 700358]OCF83603.1 phytoene synthase [Nocardia brasiliensis]
MTGFAPPAVERARRGTAAELAVAYRACRQIAARYGRTYFLATRLLSAERRPAIHALYAFARVVDDIVDHAETGAVQRFPDGTGGERSALAPAAQLDLIERRLRALLDGTVPAPDALSHKTFEAHRLALLALADTIERYDIAAAHFWTFLDAMRMDVPGTAQFRDRYATMTELREYMRGSAAAIGLQVLPVLGTVVPRAEAEPAAAALGEAFQLTNFLRDVAEDLDRGRMYLPADELAPFGVDHDLLTHCHRAGHTDARVRRGLAHLIAVNRDIYRHADAGIDLLEPRVRPAIRTASLLYAGILDRIEDSGYAVFTQRAVVPRPRRLRVAATQFATALTGR